MHQGKSGLKADACNDVLHFEVSAEEGGTQDSGAVGIVDIIVIGVIGIGGISQPLPHLQHQISFQKIEPKMGIQAVILAEIGVLQVLITEGVAHIGIIIASLPGLVPEGFPIETEKDPFRMMGYEVTDVGVVFPDASVEIVRFQGIGIFLLSC